MDTNYGVTVTIPVGPHEANRRWLVEAIESVRNQTYVVNEILVIDDVAYLRKYFPGTYYNERDGTLFCWAGDLKGCHIYETPWRSGVAHSFNFGVGLARNELVFMLGSDDYLDPECIERCVKTWEKNNKEDAYYFVGVTYLDDREEKEQFQPCGAALVTQGFWDWCGGFPPESASGASDAALMSCLWGRYTEKVVGVSEHKPLYFYRSHDESDTAKRASWQGVILETRNLVTNEFSPANT